MAWGVTHRGEFYDSRSLLWRIDIELDGYASTIADMVLGGDPLRIEWLASGDDMLLTPVKGSTATINLWSQTQFQYTSLYSSQNLYRRVSIYYGDTPTLYWRGYLNTNYSEPYNDIPYGVSLTASDGLGLLKDMPYKYTTTTKNDTYYTGRRYESQIVLDILGKLGFTEFKEFCNIYDVLMADGTGDSPFDQCLIDAVVFKDMFCYEVLEEILKKYNAVIRQLNGQFYIFRPTEFTQSTVYGRYFTAYDTKTAISVAPEQVIRRTGVDSDITDFNGGMLMVQSPLSKFTAYQDYGYKESLIDNYKFDYEYDDGALVISGWTMIGGASKFRPLIDVTDEAEGICLTHETGLYMFTEFAPLTKVTAGDVYRLSFEYKFINNTSAAIDDVESHVRMECENDTNTYYLNEVTDSETDCEWVADIAHSILVHEDTVPQGEGQWTTWARSVTGVPAAGGFMFSIMTPPANLKICYRNIIFVSTSDSVHINRYKVSKWSKGLRQWTPLGLVYFFGGGRKKVTENIYTDNVELVERTYIAENAIEAPQVEQNYILGDVNDTGMVNVLEQFRGSLAIEVTGSLSQTARDFVNSHAAAYIAGDVIVTSNENVITFTSSIAGTNFTGNTTITNATGNLAGTAATSTANQPAIAQIVTIVLTGNSGSAKVAIPGQVSKLVSWDTSLADSAAKFVTDNAAFYATINITLALEGDGFTLTEITASGGFGEVTITNFTGTLAGTLPVGDQTDAQAAVARVDTVTLTGTGGTANVLCDGTTRTATFNTGTITEYTTAWTTRGGSENKALLQVIADEIAAQYARGKHFIQMSLRERGSSTPDVNMLYNLQDSLNTVGGNARVFMANRGTFDVKRGEWSLDAHEII